MTIESVVNQALDLLGYTRHIGNIYEGTAAARVALDCWAQTRDVLFTTLDPDWARKDAILALLKSAPNIQGSAANYTAPWDSVANPPIPWLYEYTTPVDCLKPLQIKTTQTFLPVWAPRANTFRQVITDTSDTLLSNVPAAILIYIGKIGDPDMWHEEFRDAMIRLLAQKMQVGFAKGPVQKEKADADAPN